MIPHHTVFREFKGHAQTAFRRHCDVDCPFEGCAELAFELWERTTFGGVGLHKRRAIVLNHGNDDCSGFSRIEPSRTIYAWEDAIVARR